MIVVRKDNPLLRKLEPLVVPEDELLQKARYASACVVAHVQRANAAGANAEDEVSTGTGRQALCRAARHLS